MYYSSIHEPEAKILQVEELWDNAQQILKLIEFTQLDFLFRLLVEFNSIEFK